MNSCRTDRHSRSDRHRSSLRLAYRGDHGIPAKVCVGASSAKRRSLKKRQDRGERLLTKIHFGDGPDPAPQSSAELSFVWIHGKRKPAVNRGVPACVRRWLALACCRGWMDMMPDSACVDAAAVGRSLAVHVRECRVRGMTPQPLTRVASVTRPSGVGMRTTVS